MDLFSMTTQPIAHQGATVSEFISEEVIEGSLGDWRAHIDHGGMIVQLEYGEVEDAIKRHSAEYKLTEGQVKDLETFFDELFEKDGAPYLQIAV